MGAFDIRISLNDPSGETRLMALVSPGNRPMTLVRRLVCGALDRAPAGWRWSDHDTARHPDYCKIHADRCWNHPVLATAALHHEWRHRPLSLDHISATAKRPRVATPLHPKVGKGSLSVTPRRSAELRFSTETGAAKHASTPRPTP